MFNYRIDEEREKLVKEVVEKTVNVVFDEMKDIVDRYYPYQTIFLNNDSYRNNLNDRILKIILKNNKNK